ncbi:peptidase S8/S53 domain-containing protein, partial [Plectosphaerella plurivora]
MVQSKNPLKPDQKDDLLKSTIALKEAIERDTGTEDYEIDCILHESPDIVAKEVAPHVAKAAQVGEDELEVSANKIRLVINQERLADLAKLDFINRIEQVYPDVITNNLARATLMMPGEGRIGVISKTYSGQGQTICVADTGFDLGIPTSANVPAGVERHPAFKDRLIRIDTPWPGDDGFDSDGHGTHVCASICGDGVYRDKDGSEVAIQGTAPQVKILVQSLSKPLKSNPRLKRMSVPSDLTALFNAAYTDEKEIIRIHSNSWGKQWDDNVGQLDYNDQATQIDRFIYGSDDFVVLIAAANKGDAPRDPARWPSQIGAAASAKNAITVGAVGSTRPNDNRKFVRTAGGRAVTGINDTAVFSSRGPCKIGRIKPDIVAPGVAILSAASRALNAQAMVNMRRNFGDSGDNDWIFLSGTSMATPLVAGCVALLREALMDLHGNKSPSAALVKALLVNGAVNFSGKLGPGFGYDYEQGFGRIMIESSIGMVRDGTFVDGRGGDSTVHNVPGLIQTGTEAQRRWESGDIAVPAGLGRCRLVATLAYPDPAGEKLHNAMNLVVESGGASRHGNMGRDGGDGFDTANNIEKVLWDNLPGPSFKVVVKVDNNWKPHEPASFAVAWDLRVMARL